MLIAIIKRNLKEILRDRLAMTFMLLFPVVFIVVFSLAFGGRGQSPITLGIVDEDSSPASQSFIQLLEDSPSFKLKFYKDRLSAQEGVRQGTTAGMLVLPQGFGEAVSARFQTGKGEVPLYLSYDTTDILRGMLLESSLMALGQAFFKVEPPLSLQVQPLEIRIKKPLVNFFAASYSIFGMMNLIASVAAFWVTDRQKGWLTRLWTTPVTSRDLLLGYSVPFLLLAGIRPFLYLGVAYAMGAKVIGNLLLLLLPIWLVGILCIGLGMMVASLVKTVQQATGLPWLIIVPIAMLSGIFFPKENFPSYMQKVAEVFPFSHAVEAGRLVMNRGADLMAIKRELLIILFWIALVYLINLPLVKRLMRV